MIAQPLLLHHIEHLVQSMFPGLLLFFYVLCVSPRAKLDGKKKKQRRKLGGRVRLCAPAAVSGRIKTRQSFALS